MFWNRLPAAESRTEVQGSSFSELGLLSQLAVLSDDLVHGKGAVSVELLPPESEW